MQAVLCIFLQVILLQQVIQTCFYAFVLDPDMQDYHAGYQICSFMDCIINDFLLDNIKNVIE